MVHLHRFLKHRFLLPVICAAVSVAGLVSLSVFVSDSHLFDRYTTQYAKQLLSSDTLSLHYALADPSATGLSDLPVTLGELTIPDAVTEHLTCENTAAVLSSFSPERLSDVQKLTLEILKDTNEREQKLIPGCLLWDQPSSSLGLTAQLPVLLAEYRFRTADDVKTYLLLLADTRRYLGQYADVLVQKADAGYAPAKETLDALCAQCETFLGSEDSSHFLQTVFLDKCKALGLFSEAELTQLGTVHLQLLKERLFAACHAFTDRLKTLYPKAHARTGLAGYDGGSAYYEAWLQYSCGTDLSVSAIRKRLYRQLLQDMDALQNLSSAAFTMADPCETLSARQMLLQLSERIQPFFPAAAPVSFTLLEVQPELQAYSSPAYYMIPPVDDPSSNTIYINPAENLHGFSLYTTLAHEGFPGHMYQTTYFYRTSPPLLRRLLSFGGYTEGWATYTESLLCEIVSPTYEGARLYWLDRSLNLCLSSLLDLSIHADGWDLQKTAAFLADFGITDPDSADALYQYCIENPGNYLKYYLGCLSFLDLRASLKQEMGADFSLKDFHEAILSTGPCSFPVLTRAVRQKLGLSKL